VRTGDDLLVAGDEVGRRDPIRLRRDRAGVPEVVDAEQDDDVAGARLRADVPVEPAQRALAELGRKRVSARAGQRVGIGSSRLPLIPSLSTPSPSRSRVACRRRASASGEGAFRSGVVLAPSVIESPSATTAPSPAGAATLTPDRNHVPGSPSWVRCRWVKVWLPIHMPARCPVRTRSGLASELLPWSNIVARRWLPVSAASSWVVVALGPSSKVRPT
jgi:hypothetical protein